MALTVVMTGDEEDPGEPLSLAREALFAAQPQIALAPGRSEPRAWTGPDYTGRSSRRRRG
jgi:hypothetical protein